MSPERGWLDWVSDHAGKLVGAHFKMIVLVFLVLTLVMAYPMTQLETASRLSDFIPENEFGAANEMAMTEFNGTTMVTTIVKADDGNILDRDGLLTLMALERGVRSSQEVAPFLVLHRDAVVSVADAVEEGLRAASNGSLGIENAPEELLGTVVSVVLTEGNHSILVSKGATERRPMAILLVVVDYRMHAHATEEGDETMELAIEESMETAAPPGYEVYSMGGWNTDLESNTQRDLSILLPITILVLSVIFLMALRSVTDWAISFLGLGVITVISFGLFGLLGLKFTQMTFFAPILILILSIDFIVHILMRYNEEAEAGAEPPVTMSRALRFIGMSVLVSSFTTIVAFASNGLSDIPAVSGFGVFLAIGIGVSLLVMMLFVPSLKLLALNRKPAGSSGPRAHDPKPGHGRRGRVLRAVHRAVQAAPVFIIVIALCLTGVAYYVSTFLEKDMSPQDLMAEGSEKVVALDILDKDFEGVGMDRVSIIVKGDIADPKVLRAMDATVANMADDEHVATTGGRTSVVSVLDYVRAVVSSGALSVTDADGDGLPDRRDEAVMVLEHLYEGGIPGVVHSRDVHAVLSRGDAPGTFDMAQIRIEARDVGGTKCSGMLVEIEEDSDPVEGVEGTEVYYAGYVFERHVLLDSMTEGMVVSTVTTTIICAIMVIMLFGSVRLGLTTAIPVVLVTVWVLGAAYLLGYSLNPITATTTAMTVGIGIDYSIHLTQRYRQERWRGRSTEKALEVSMERTGVALLVAGATTATGFGIIALSNIGMFRAFGVMAFLIISLVLLATILVLPAMLIVGDRLATMWSRPYTIDPKGARNGR